MNSDEYRRIVESYRVNHSLSATAAETGFSTGKVMRVLITEGLWESPMSRDVAKLHSKGYSVAEIAELMDKSQGNVQAYMPYSKEAIEDGGGREAGQRAEANDRIIPFAAVRGRQAADTAPGSMPAALQLHLELGGLDRLDAQDKKILTRYGGVKHSVSRDILVPATMTLRALHYCIQRLFGWQNSHLHRFYLPDRVYEEMTGGSVAEFFELCGAYFRFSYPDDSDMEDVYWDNDYDDRKSFARWEKEKYCGPYEYAGQGDHRIFNEIEVEQFQKTYPDAKNMTLREAQKRYGEWDWNWLLERLPVGSLLGSRGIRHSDFQPGVPEMKCPDGCARLLNDEISHVKQLTDDLHRMKKETVSILQSGKIDTCLSLLDVYGQAVTGLAMDSLDPDVIPVTNEILYDYDYGDGWQVKITCTKLFQGSLKKGEELKQVIFSKDADVGYDPAVVRKVAKHEKPVCLAFDGHSLMDDVGGLEGYVNFLDHLYADGKSAGRADEFTDVYDDTPEALRTWARSVGWQEKMPSLKNML